MCGRVFLSTDGDAIAAVLGLLHDGKATGLPHADLPPTVTLPVVAVGRQGPVVTGSRLMLVEATRRILAQGLGLLGIPLPERM